VKTPRLREWREAMGETQATLGERSGVAEHTISRIEHGASLRPTTARKLADALGVAVADLMERPPVPLGDAPQGTGSPHHVRRPHDSIEVSDEVKKVSVRLEKVRQILDARDAGKLDDVDADKEIQREYQQEDPAA
jgi:transcriptional regulator with XRE-family HTH domain